MNSACSSIYLILSFLPYLSFYYLSIIYLFIVTHIFSICMSDTYITVTKFSEPKLRHILFENNGAVLI